MSSKNLKIFEFFSGRGTMSNEQGAMSNGRGARTGKRAGGGCFRGAFCRRDWGFWGLLRGFVPCKAA
jgi:hypothetical protein